MNNEKGIKEVNILRDKSLNGFVKRNLKLLLSSFELAIKALKKFISFNLNVMRSFDYVYKFFSFIKHQYFLLTRKRTIKIVYVDDKEFVYYGTYSVKFDNETWRNHYIKRLPIEQLSLFKKELGI